MEYQSQSQKRLVTVIIILISLVGILMMATDWKEMRGVLARSDWRYFIGVIISTFLSYICYSYAYALISQMLGIQMGKRELAEACFVSTIVNHVLTSGGMVGYSLRYLIMKMYGVSLKDTMASSILHYYLTSLDMLTFLPLAFIYLLVQASVPRSIATALGLMTVLCGLILVIFTILVLFPSRRRLIIHLLYRLGKTILHRDYLPWLTQMDESLTLGTRGVLQKPIRLVMIMFLTLVDFSCSVAALGFCFAALGLPVRASILLTGYVIGTMAGLLSMLPGGFGVQEGSMAGIFMLLGVQFEQGVLASILFRIFYYLLPYFLVLMFYNRLLRSARRRAPIES